MRAFTVVALLCLAPSPTWADGSTRAPVTKDGKKPVGPAADGTEAADTPPPPTQNREQALADAKAASESGDGPVLAKSLRVLRISSNLAGRVDSLVRAGIEHLESGAWARAEKSFQAALEANPDQELAQLGLAGAKKARSDAEAQALKDVADADDPRAAARMLVAGYEADPNSANAKQGFKLLKARIEKNVTELSDAEVAHAIEALSILENTEGDMIQRIAKASEVLAAGRAAEAQAAYEDARVGVLGNARSEVAAWAVDWVKQRRIAALEVELESVSKSGDVVDENRIVQALLALDPQHRQANQRAKTLRKRVVAARLASAAAHQDKKEYGPAFIYLRKGLQTAPDDPKLTAEMKAVKEELKKRSDLILVVSEVEEISSCPGFSELLRTDTQEATSRREDLGAYVLSPGWTDAFEKNDPRVPAVEGRLVLKVQSCAVEPAAGKATVTWSVQVPRVGEAAGVVVQGQITEAVDETLVPKDEQDAEGKGATAQLADRVANEIGDRMSEERDAMDQWLLVLGETLRKQGDDASAADAYARLIIDKPLMVDQEAMDRLGSDLSQTYR